MAETANPRQMFDFSVGGVQFSTRPSFKIITAVEAVTGQSCVQLGLKILRAEAAMSEICLALFEVLRGQDGAPKTVEALGETLMEDGWTGIQVPLGKYLATSLRGNRAHERDAADEAERKRKEAEAAGETMDPPTAGSTSKGG